MGGPGASRTRTSRARTNESRCRSMWMTRRHARRSRPRARTNESRCRSIWMTTRHARAPATASPGAPGAWASLAPLARVRPAPGGDELAHRRAADRARLALAAVDEELVLEGALDAVGMAEVVDRRTARAEARLERRDDRVAQRGDLAALQRARAAQRMDAGAKERLVGVDVADARDAALVQQQRLDRRAPLARLQVEVLGREVRAERLDAQAAVEELLQRGAAERELAGAEAARVTEAQDVGVVELQAHAGVGRV